MTYCVWEDNLAERWEPRTKLRKCAPDPNQKPEPVQQVMSDRDYAHTLSVIMTALMGFPEARMATVRALEADAGLPEIPL